MAFFDGIRDNAVAIVNNTMGYKAVWKIEGEYVVDFVTDYTEGSNAGMVLYNCPTHEVDDLENQSFNEWDAQMEFLLPNFEGMMALVDDAQKQIVAIDLTSRGEGIREFYVKQVTAKAKTDGRTHVANLKYK